MKKLLALLLLVALPAHALSVDEKLADPAQEARAEKLFYALRCVVCEGEAIAESPAAVASDMRREVREEIAAGKNDDDIKTAMVARYGERVLMMPEKNARNAPLFIVPLLLLAGGLAFAWRNVFGSRP